MTHTSRKDPMTLQLTKAHQDHLNHIKSLWMEALDHCRHDAVWLSAGTEAPYFRDDHGPAFRPNAYFTQWVDPAYAHPGALLRITRDGAVDLFTPQPQDYWHAVPDVPEYLAGAVTIHTFPSVDATFTAAAAQAATAQASAFIGTMDAGANEQLGTPCPKALLDFMDYHRAQKTNFELELMRTASEIGVRGHIAAEAAFRQNATEFDIHMAYLAASQQSESALPYANIVALNRHASFLHYQHQDRTHADPPRSLLIDAGGCHQGYASDITRTYVAEGGQHDTFRGLLSRMQAHQQALLSQVQPGIRFADLHHAMHMGLSHVLVDCELVSCSAEEALTQGITRAFCPHGLGHLLGLQVHDAGGHLANPWGEIDPPASEYPALRFTRAVAQDYVFTIEPGLYFIDMLLDELAANKAPVNWPLVDTLRPYGGIRIEDNVRVTATGIENLTRDAWRRVGAA